MAKTCVKCGVDCSDRRRVKDNAGHYMCGTCFDAAKAQPAVATVVTNHISDPDDGPIGLAAVDGDIGSARSCPRCGVLVSESARLCTQCGTNLVTGQPPAAPGTRVPRACTSCGYDLRGLPMECDCPECGTHNTAPKPQRGTRTPKSELANYYIRPAKAGAFGLIALAVIRLSAQQPMLLAIDSIVLVVLVPLGLLAYFLFSIIWAGGFDQAWGLAAVNLFAAMAISSAVSAGASYVPLPILPGMFSLVAYLLLLQKYLDLDDWKDALILAIILWGLQLLLIVAIGAAYVAIK